MPKTTRKNKITKTKKTKKNKKNLVSTLTKRFIEEDMKKFKERIVDPDKFGDNVKRYWRENMRDYPDGYYTAQQIDFMRSNILGRSLDSFDKTSIYNTMMNTVGPSSSKDIYDHYRTRNRSNNKNPITFSFSKKTGLPKPHVRFEDGKRKKGGGPAGQPLYLTRQITREAEIERKKQSLKRELANKLNISINLVNYYSNIYTGNWNYRDTGGLMLSNLFINFVKEKEEIRKRIEEERRVAEIEREKKKKEEEEKADEQRRTLNEHAIFVDGNNNPLYIFSKKVIAPKKTAKFATEIKKFYEKNKDNIDSFSFTDATKIVEKLRKKGMTYPQIQNYQIPQSYKYKKKIGKKISKMKDKMKKFARTVTRTRRARVAPMGGRKKTKRRRTKRTRKRKYKK